MPPVADDPVNSARGGWLQSTGVSDVVNALDQPTIRVDMSLWVVSPTADERDVVAELPGVGGGFA